MSVLRGRVEVRALVLMQTARRRHNRHSFDCLDFADMPWLIRALFADQPSPT